MRNSILVPIFLLFFLQGCYQTSLAPIIGPAAGASQGRLAYSAASTSISYGVKHKTGKFPIEHILKREKDKLVKKVLIIEKEIIKTSSVVKKKIINEKNNVAKIRWVLDVKEIRTVTEEEAFPANKPRYSYWSGQK